MATAKAKLTMCAIVALFALTATIVVTPTTAQTGAAQARASMPAARGVAMGADIGGTFDVASWNTGAATTGAVEALALTPGNGPIAFYTSRDGNEEIYVMNADGSGQTRLTSEPALDEAPAWSPDGSKIAFQSDRDGNVEIYVMNADGSDQTRLTANGAGDIHPVWSPDGAKIAFYSVRDGDNEIYVMNADGSGQTRLTTNAANDSNPAWAPDGTKLAFASDRGGNWEIYIMNADGTGVTLLPAGPADDVQPDWSPDGTKLVFMSRRDGNEEIYVMNADGSDQARLTTSPGWDAAPDWGVLPPPPPPPAPNVVVNTNDSGSGSLRQALADANSDPAANTIAFHIPASDAGFNGKWFTIRPLTHLPSLTDDGTTIDGSTQTVWSGNTNPAGPEIELSGSLAPAGTNGLDVFSSDNRIHSLVVNGFAGVPAVGNGINITGSGNVVTGSYVGVDATGSSVVANGNNGVHLGEGTANRVGGETAAERNVLSGNGIQGITISSSYNTVAGNFIGTDATGAKPLGNGSEGILLTSGAHDNTVGGADPNARNVISANRMSGVFIGSIGGASNNLVEGNFIGTDVTGTLLLGNGEDGVRIVSDVESVARRNRIIRNLVKGSGEHGVGLFSADQTVIQGNRLEGNNQSGVRLGDGPTHTTSTGNLIGGTSAGQGNVISGNGFFGVMVFDSAQTTIQGNLIGTDANGNVAFGNAVAGIAVAGSTDTLIGGTTAGARNVISGNTGTGIAVGGTGGPLLRTTIQGNFIGTNAMGTAPLGNRHDGINFFATSGPSSDNVVGGTDPGAGNVISGNGNAGVGMRDVSGIVVQGNLIGTDASGTTAIPNAQSGVQLVGVTDALIGGTTSGARNVISGNGMGGIALGGTGTVVQGNYIGTNAAGTAALPNGTEGVFGNATGAVIGGAAAGAGNVISHNGRFGVLLFGSGGNRVEANTISGNGRAGVVVGTGTGNTFTRNSIVGNGELGIELAPLGVNANDPGDADTGANNLQNYPVLTRAIASAGRLVVQGTIDTPNPETVTIELFASAVPMPGGDPSGHGEGAVFLGTVTPNVQGRFVAVLPPVAGGMLVTATATDAAGNTSEFAANVTALGPGPP